MADPHGAARHVPFRSPADSEPEPASVATTLPTAMVAALKRTGQPAGSRESAPEEEDYSGWLTVAQFAEQLGVAKGTTYNLVRRYVRTVKVYGRLLIDPVSAAEYKVRHDFTRRTPPPIAK